MSRTMTYRTTEKPSLLLDEDTVAFRLTQQCERSAAQLGVPAGTRVRVELLNDGGHLLDFLNYVASPVDG
jgi:hypothetical protein